MDMIWNFLKVYGLLLSTAVLTVALSAMVVGCVIRMKQLESRVNDMEKALSERMDAAAQDAKDDSKRQRRLLNESMASLSESMTRAILTMNGAEQKKKDGR